ncbi:MULTISPECIES: SpaA isopeptide-forming pilin-related protein [Lacticaseibacillus]|jgi:uncharacterized surface anchored protein|uniref:SpaA isopeptide-forming pilin-related protein n=1 Tax=Lacticaseibacillus huelsenbergensis TaxID=3035291 RepID=A0ABY8DS00_9LACO|nr:MULTISPECIES: SpaA isopeptide-forming pilin-related protein [Lacticaseibacillus]MDG3061454.1 SpaA isopeptide-forming pilin-related protein [Lacticaseibacillus sp. BCRC 81376]WFB39765.1 SpaA isopeptide-forming pilin-related protein [Lacticaseibacillus huelsenbergensis]
MQIQNRIRKYTSSWLLLTLLLASLTFLFSPLISPPTVVDAGKNVPVSGLNRNDATITDINQKDVTHTARLSRGQLYYLTYHWQISDGVTVNAGDTAEFSLPSSVLPQSDISFKILNPGTQETIGNVFVKAGSSQGLITFTDFFSQKTVKREGTLKLQVNGRFNDPDHQQVSWYINKAGWVVTPPKGNHAADSNQYVDSLGRPKLFQWQITLNPQGKTIHDVVLHDTLDAGQKFDTSHALTAATGTYSQNAFHQNGTIKVAPQVNGREMTIPLGTITTAVEVSLWTNPLSTSFGSFSGDKNTWNNQVTATGSQDSGLNPTAKGQITWNNTGVGIGSVSQVKLTKVGATRPQQPLKGETFALYRNDGKLVKNGLTTDKNGSLSISQLLAGQYQFLETKALAGYRLNRQPIKFTLTKDHPRVAIKSADMPIAPASSSNSSSTSNSSASSAKPSSKVSSSSKPSKPSSEASRSSKPSEPSSKASSSSETSEPSSKAPSSSTKPSNLPSMPSSTQSSASSSSHQVASSKSSSSVPESASSTGSSDSSASLKPSMGASSSAPTRESASSTSESHTSQPAKSAVTSSVASSDTALPTDSDTNTQSGQNDSSTETINPHGKHASKRWMILPNTGERLVSALSTAIGIVLTVLGSVLFFKNHR